MKHLWEIDHPYYAADGYRSDFESFAEMRHAADRLDEDMNHIYRWDWEDDSHPARDDYFLGGDYRGGQRLKLAFILPRKSAFMEWQCPIGHDQEVEVLEWLRGPRVLGAMRKLWEPILDEPGATS